MVSWCLVTAKWISCVKCAPDKRRANLADVGKVCFCLPVMWSLLSLLSWLEEAGFTKPIRGISWYSPASGVSCFKKKSCFFSYQMGRRSWITFFFAKIMQWSTEGSVTYLSVKNTRAVVLWVFKCFCTVDVNYRWVVLLGSWSMFWTYTWNILFLSLWYQRLIILPFPNFWLPLGL